MKVNRTRRVKDMYMRGTLKVNKYIQKIDELNAYITIKEMEEVEEKNYLHINGNEVCNAGEHDCIDSYQCMENRSSCRKSRSAVVRYVSVYFCACLRHMHRFFLCKKSKAAFKICMAGRNADIRKKLSFHYQWSGSYVIYSAGPYYAGKDGG